jgi:hypothetical protein
MKLEWTSEFPGKEGYYWISITYGMGQRHQYIHYIQEDGNYYEPTIYDDEHMEHVLSLGKHARFYGPIKEPTPPNK